MRYTKDLIENYPDNLKMNEYKTPVYSFKDNKELSKIVHQLSHDIGNPLTSIITYSGITENASKMNVSLEKISSYAGITIKETWKIANILEKFVLLVSQKSTSSLINLEELAEKTKLKLNRFDLSSFFVTFENFQPEYKIKADSEQFPSILIELISNASQAINYLESKNIEIDRTLVLKARQIEDNKVEISLTNPTHPHTSSLENLCQIGTSENSSTKAGIGIGIPAISNAINKWGGDLYISIKEKAEENLNYFKARLTLPLLKD